MPQPNDLSRSLVALDQNSTIIAVVEMSQSSWLVGGVVPGIERQPRKKLEPSPERLLALLHRWRDEAVKAGKKITRIALAFEAGRDGFWLARWLAARGVEPHVIHASSVAVSREHRRAKTDRLDTELRTIGIAAANHATEDGTWVTPRSMMPHDAPGVQPYALPVPPVITPSLTTLIVLLA
jgi:transposase